MIVETTRRRIRPTSPFGSDLLWIAAGTWYESEAFRRRAGLSQRRGQYISCAEKMQGCLRPRVVILPTALRHDDFSRIVATLLTCDAEVIDVAELLQGAKTNATA